MGRALADQLEKLCEEGSRADSVLEFERWSVKVAAFLKTAVGPTEASDFQRLTEVDDFEQHARRLGHLQGLMAKVDAESSTTVPISGAASGPNVAGPPAKQVESTKVFVVHGHDNEAKELTARFLTRLGLQPIILHEQPSAGRTIIEKFESYSGDIA